MAALTTNTLRNISSTYCIWIFKWQVWFKKFIFQISNNIEHISFHNNPTHFNGALSVLHYSPPIANREFTLIEYPSIERIPFNQSLRSPTNRSTTTTTVTKNDAHVATSCRSSYAFSTSSPTSPSSASEPMAVSYSALATYRIHLPLSCVSYAPCASLTLFASRVRPWDTPAQKTQQSLEVRN